MIPLSSIFFTFLFSLHDQYLFLPLFITSRILFYIFPLLPFLHSLFVFFFIEHDRFVLYYSSSLLLKLPLPRPLRVIDT